MPDEAVNSPPRLPPDITREECVKLWIDLCETAEVLLLAGLRREVGPDGDLRAAYRAWRERWSAEHDKKWENMARKMAQKGRDVDLLIAIPYGSEQQVIDTLLAAGVRPKSAPPIRPLGDVRIAQFLYEPPEALIDIQIDLLIADAAFHQQALRRRVPTELDGVAIDVLRCEDLILLKLLAGRILDRADVIACSARTRPRWIRATWTNGPGA